MACSSSRRRFRSSCSLNSYSVCTCVRQVSDGAHRSIDRSTPTPATPRLPTFGRTRILDQGTCDDMLVLLVLLMLRWGRGSAQQGIMDYECPSRVA